jgi:hypothetical protein
VRACQVTDEIACLLENGFADGAMARWRTLHEIAMVAAVISQHGEAIAERYLAHQFVESKRAMDKYLACYKQLGYGPLPLREQKKFSATSTKSLPNTANPSQRIMDGPPSTSTTTGRPSLILKPQRGVRTCAHTIRWAMTTFMPGPKAFSFGWGFSITNCSSPGAAIPV